MPASAQVPANRSSLKAYLQLMRPANIVTAMADILAGFALVSIHFEYYYGVIKNLPNVYAGIWMQLTEFGVFPILLLLLLSTIGLYGGGVVFNDIFDAKLDAVERPERPIPSGRASLQGATILGLVLLLLGVTAAFLVSAISGLFATAVAFCALVYDKWGKHTMLGPLNMGLCRGLNLLLGVSGADAIGGWTVYPPLSAVETSLPLYNNLEKYWYLALIPIIYIAAITSISRGEVHGGNRRTMNLAFALYCLVILAIAGLAVVHLEENFWQALLFLAFFSYLIFPPLFKAIKEPVGRNIGRAVKAGVISLIVMDAAIATAFAGWLYGLAVLALLPVSRILAKKFAVT